MQNQLPKQQPNWYAIYTRSRSEKKLYGLLQQKNVECFLPLKKTLVQRSDRKKWVEVPLIPSYLFVKVTEKQHYTVLNTPGAVHYVSFDGKAATIPDEQIAHLNKLLVNKSQDIEIYHGSFDKGDLVEVKEGPMKGVKGEVVEIRGKQRLLLRFESLGYCIHVEASADELKLNKAVAKAFPGSRAMA